MKRALVSLAMAASGAIGPAATIGQAAEPVPQLRGQPSSPVTHRPVVAKVPDSKLQPAANPTASRPAAPAIPLVPAPTREGSWPRTIGESQPSDKPTVSWNPAEIEQARAECRAILQGVDAVVQPVEPFRHDSGCGAPAAMQLISVGRNPEIAISPPVIVTCDLVAALARWTKSELQPLARKHLFAPIIRIETMSSYSCRNVYGRRNSRLSEHGKANAIDIRGFTTAAGQQTAVLDDWGLTQRAIEAKIAAAKAEVAKAALAANQVKAAPSARAPTPVSSGVAAAQAPGQPTIALTPTATMSLNGPADTVATQSSPEANRPTFSTIVEGLPSLARRLPSLTRPAEIGVGFGERSRLGGPKPVEKAQPIVRRPDARDRSLFHRAVHETACKVFGTVLGPEANRAHENHYHFDMAERSLGSYCE